MCLLSSVTSEDFSCACPGGGEIMDDGITCDCKLLGDQNQHFKQFQAIVLHGQSCRSKVV